MIAGAFGTLGHTVRLDALSALLIAVGALVIAQALVARDLWLQRNEARQASPMVVNNYGPVTIIGSAPTSTTGNPRTLWTPSPGATSSGTANQPKAPDHE